MRFKFPIVTPRCNGARLYLRFFASASSETKGYQSIGSFHNDSLAEMVAQGDDTYQAPPLPFDDQALVVGEHNQIDHDVRKDFFLDFDQ